MIKISKKTLFIIIIFTILIISLIIFLALPKIKKANIKSTIKKANYCEMDSDCVDAGSKCPFGCYAYVNKNEVERISKLIQSYNSNCVYGCVSCPTAICENKKCKEVCK